MAGLLPAGPVGRHPSPAQEGRGAVRAAGTAVVAAAATAGVNVVARTWPAARRELRPRAATRHRAEEPATLPGHTVARPSSYLRRPCGPAGRLSTTPEAAPVEAAPGTGPVGLVEVGVTVGKAAAGVVEPAAQAGRKVTATAAAPVDGRVAAELAGVAPLPCTGPSDQVGAPVASRAGEGREAVGPLPRSGRVRGEAARPFPPPPLGTAGAVPPRALPSGRRTAPLCSARLQVQTTTALVLEAPEAVGAPAWTEASVGGPTAPRLGLPSGPWARGEPTARVACRGLPPAVRYSYV